MDFGKINTRDAADKGAVMHVKHPIFGHQLYVGEGADEDGRLTDRNKPHEKITVTIRGYHAPTVSEVFKDNKQDGVRSDAEAEMLGEQLADVLIVSWQNVEWGGKPLKCTAENKVKWIEQDPGLFQQVNEFAQDRANFFKNGSRG